MRRTRRRTGQRRTHLASLAAVASLPAAGPTALALTVTLAPVAAAWSEVGDAAAAPEAVVGVEDAVPAPASAPGNGNGEIGCLTYVSQFRGAVLRHPGSPRLAEAQALAREGEALCKQRRQAPARAKLGEALRLLGVTPKDRPQAPPVEIEGLRPAPGTDVAEHPQR